MLDNKIRDALNVPDSNVHMKIGLIHVHEPKNYSLVKEKEKYIKIKIRIFTSAVLNVGSKVWRNVEQRHNNFPPSNKYEINFGSTCSGIFPHITSNEQLTAQVLLANWLAVTL